MYFWGLASAFNAIETVKNEGGSIVSISIDLDTYAAAVVAKTAPLLSDQPISNTAVYVRNYLYQVAIVKYVKAMVPAKSFSTTLHPGATPAYPSIWKGQGPNLSR